MTIGKPFVWVTAITAACMKLLGIILFRHGNSWFGLNIFMFYDRPPLLVAGYICDSLFHPRRIGPGAQEALLFDVLVILFTFFEWGMVAHFLGRFIRYISFSRRNGDT